jgi:glycosyltransferase involved in cell wall biosynthesis
MGGSQPIISQELRPRRAKLSLVVPVFNEQDTVGQFISTVQLALYNEPDIDLEFVFVNDGSSDDTLAVLLELQLKNPQVCVVDLS